MRSKPQVDAGRAAGSRRYSDRGVRKPEPHHAQDQCRDDSRGGCRLSRPRDRAPRERGPTTLAAADARLERRSAASSLFNPLIDQYANLHKVEAAIGLMQHCLQRPASSGSIRSSRRRTSKAGGATSPRCSRCSEASSSRWSRTTADPDSCSAYPRGETALYGETRDYVRRVLSRLQTAR